MTKDTLYYDGACPLCAREMKHLAKLKRDSLELVDIHNTDITDDMPSKVRPTADNKTAVGGHSPNQFWLYAMLHYPYRSF